jgi:hypothetical protein
MYEIERYIGNGTRSAFFRIRDHPSLGIKISFQLLGLNAKENLEQELKNAKIARQLEISTPRYVDVILVKVPEHIEETLQKASQQRATAHKYFDSMKNFFIACKGQTL